jgi:hypothetical protein
MTGSRPILLPASCDAGKKVNKEIKNFKNISSRLSALGHLEMKRKNRVFVALPSKIQTWRWRILNH